MSEQLSQKELQRYARHLSVAKIGLGGQKKLKQASVLCIGAGGIGSPAILYLAAMGVGRLGIIDFDHVEISNLQRQILFTEDECGQSKAALAGKKATALNSALTCLTYHEKLTLKNAETIIQDFDIVLDGSDNFSTRYLVNDVCAYLKKPLISASILQFSGQLAVFTGESPCYRCVFPEPPPAELAPACSDAGVPGVLPGIFGTLAVNEVTKLILGLPGLQNQLAQIDTLNLDINKFNIQARSDCPVCVKKTPLIELHPPLTQPNTAGFQLAAETFKQWQAAAKNFTLIDVREDWERAITALPNDIHIPLGTFNPADIELPKETTIVVYCRLGGRSNMATQKLIDLVLPVLTA